jgi:hypothetical protein
MIARLIGPNQAMATDILTASSLEISVHQNLSPALDEAGALVSREVS